MRRRTFIGSLLATAVAGAGAKRTVAQVLGAEPVEPAFALARFAT